MIGVEEKLTEVYPYGNEWVESYDNWQLSRDYCTIPSGYLRFITSDPIYQQPIAFQSLRIVSYYTFGSDQVVIFAIIIFYH